MSGMFLDKGVEHVEDQMKKEREESRKMQAEGYVKVRELNVINGNRFKNGWVKKDEATVRFEEEMARKDALKRRSAEVERKAQMLDMMKKEKELEEKAAELDALEKELSKPTKKEK